MRRENIYSASPPSSPDPDPELEQLSLTFAKQQYQNFVEAPLPSAPENNDTRVNDDELVSFRLFKPTVTNGTIAPKVRVRSPSVGEQQPGFVRPNRPESFYFAINDSENELERIKESAVGGQEVLLRSNQPWPGCAMPWRVTMIGLSGKQLGILGNHHDVAEDNARSDRRRRLGKKHRIALRAKLAAAQAAHSLARKQAAEKGEAEREKKTRRNREKKVKKKERDKAKKATGITEMSTIHSKAAEMN